MKIILYGLVAFIFLLGGVLLYPYMRFEFRKRLERDCFVENRYSKRVILAWDRVENLDVYFGAHGSEECICPDFPAIGVKSQAAGRWIQVIEVNVNVPEFSGEVGWRLGKAQFPWFFADTSTDHRKAEIPFYGWGDRDQMFWDHPCWNIGSSVIQWFTTRNQQPIKWMAHLYRVRVDEQAIEAIAGVQWGWYEDQEKRIFAIDPSSLTPLDWRRDSELLQGVYSKWKFLAKDSAY